MIQINLLADNVQAQKPAGMTSRTQAIPVTSPDLDLDLDLDEEPKKKSKLPLILGLGAALAIGGGAAAYFAGQGEEEVALPAATGTKAAKPETKPAKPVDAPKVEAPKAPAKDSVKADAPKPVEVKAEPKVEPKPEPKPEPKVAAKPEVKPEPKAAPAAAGPSVKAAPLPANSLADVLSKSHVSAVSGEKPNRFDALTPAGRTAYQKFAFQRILAILRQITPADGLGFSKVRIASPGLISIQGTATKSDALVAFQKGLAAQSLADTSTATGKDAAFAVVARLPFNPSFGGMAVPATDVRKALQQALDLAAPQGLALKASAGRSETVAGAKRTAWTLTGQGGWDAISGWLAGLQSAASPIGFTELVITAGDKGKLQVTVTAVCYGP